MSSVSEFSPILVADIGGTNARLGLVTGYNKQNNTFTLDHTHTFPSADFSSLESVVTQYFDLIKPLRPVRACLAVAGPVKGNFVHLTNLGWQFDVDTLARRFDFTALEVINDFAAFAYAAPYLDTSKNVAIKPGTADEQANIAVLGPGTGFGAAALVKNGDNAAVLSCEAGHITLAGVTELDAKLIKEIKKEQNHVSVETVFSGPGLERLYRAMARVQGATVKTYSAAQISELAMSGQCDVCLATLRQFCDWIGSVAGDLALTFGARGGVYIGGGILPRMVTYLQNGAFCERFSNKGIMAPYVSNIPVTLVTQNNIPFIGAAACLISRHGQA